jgi:hypothetical protein
MSGGYSWFQVLFDHEEKWKCDYCPKAPPRMKIASVIVSNMRSTHVIKLAG